MSSLICLPPATATPLPSWRGLAAGLVGTAGFAALALRATGISFIMITLALGEIIWGLAYRWISITGGDNGISVSTRPAPFGLSLNSPRAFYVATLIVFLLAVVSVRDFRALAVRRRACAAPAISRAA